MSQFLLLVGGVFCFFSVALGAFGAHKLRDTLTETSMNSYETGVSYQMTHGLALILVALCSSHWSAEKSFIFAGILFAIGTVLFSGSLYVLALTDFRRFLGFPVGLITPIGGTCLLIGWLTYIVAASNLLRH